MAKHFLKIKCFNYLMYIKLQFIVCNISTGSMIFEADDKKMEDFIFHFGSINDKSNFVGSFSPEGFDMLSDDDEIYDFNNQLEHQRFYEFPKSLEVYQLESQSNNQVMASKEELGFKINDFKGHLFPSGESIEQWLKPTDKKKVKSTSLQSLKNEEGRKWFSNYHQDKNVEDSLYQKKKESFKQSNNFAANKLNDGWLKAVPSVAAGKKPLTSFIDNCSNILNADYSLYLCNARFKKAQPKRPNLSELYKHGGLKNNADKKSKFINSTALSQMDDILQRSSDFYLIHKIVKAPEARRNLFASNQSAGSFVDHCNDIINSHNNQYLRVIPALEQHSYPISFLQRNFYLPSKKYSKSDVHSVLSQLEEVLNAENHLYLKPVRKTKSEADFLKNKWLVNNDRHNLREKTY